jgi:hypothetical protein
LRAKSASYAHTTPVRWDKSSTPELSPAPLVCLLKR